MGLLRRAVVAAVRGEPPRETGTAVEAPPEPRRGPGLLKRSLQARRRDSENVPPPPQPEAEPLPLAEEAPPSSLTIELAGEESIAIPLPVRVESPAAATGPASGPVEEAFGATRPAAATGARSSALVIEEIRTAVASLRGGMELPSRLFTALGSLLRIRKGALLLYDAIRLVYAPWAQRGFDQTTRHRMRIALGANEAWNALANGRPLVLSGAPALASFQPFFSSREFASVQRLILTPFIADDKLAAVLLVTDLDSPLSTEAELIECLAAASEAGAPRVQDARAARMAQPGPARPETSAPKDDLSQFLASLTGRPAVLLVSLSVEEFSRQVLAAHEDLDPFRLHEDLQFFLGTFLADVGKALAVRPGRFTLALPDFDAGTLDVFGHQLQLFLRGLFDGDTAAGAAEPAAVRIMRTASWPGDGSDLRSLVESLSS